MAAANGSSIQLHFNGRSKNKIADSNFKVYRTSDKVLSHARVSTLLLQCKVDADADLCVHNTRTCSQEQLRVSIHGLDNQLRNGSDGLEVPMAWTMSSMTHISSLPMRRHGSVSSAPFLTLITFLDRGCHDRLEFYPSLVTAARQPSAHDHFFRQGVTRQSSSHIWYGVRCTHHRWYGKDMYAFHPQD